MRTLKAITIFILIFGLHFQALATNTNSADFELSSSMSLSIANGVETGLDLADDFSIEVWVKVESIGNNALIVSKMFGDTGTGGYLFRISSDNKLRLWIYKSDGSAYQREIADVAITSAWIGVWHHLAATADVSAQDLKLYVDGSLVASTFDGTYNAIDASGADFLLGAYDHSSTGYWGFFDGKLDDVRVWSGIRDVDEINDNMSIEDPVAGADTLVGYWKLNDSLLDETANDNDLTNNNSVTFPTDPAFEDAAAPAINNEQIILFE